MQIFKKEKTIAALVAMILVFSLSTAALAQTPNPQLSQQEQADLQQQLQDIENQIAVYEQQLTQIKGAKTTLQNKIKTLQKQQASLNLQIQATNLQINSLSSQITDTQNSIAQNVSKSIELKHQIALAIQEINQHDNYPFLYVLVSQNNLSDASQELQNYLKLSDNLSALLTQTKETNDQLNQQQQNLAQQQDDAKNFLSIKTLQQQQLTGSVSQQNDLLVQTKGQEATYQAVLANQQQQAAQIRNRLYDLLGVNTQITFGDAVKVAQWASGATGVRASFLLAILTQESNLGKNVGTCNRPGDPPEKSWRVVMKPDRDQAPFMQITMDLGMDPNITPVSCPMHDKNGKQVGWGGAMGPAQFIPSTWVGYKDKVTAITGKASNPWDIRDAFLASAIKLAADGATSQSGEWAAAMRYFSGGTNVKYRFYGDNVVATANQYQSDIDELK